MTTLDVARDVAPEEADPGRRGRLLEKVLFAVPVVWIAVVGWTHRWMTEDGFIYLRIVRQINEGNGPVFNAGERVEAFTGVLWVGLLSLADLVTPVRLEWLSVLLGLAATTAAIALALAGARRLWTDGTDRSELFVPFGVIVFAALYPVWAYATSGLETGVVFAWLGACLWILSGWARSPARRISAPQAVVLGLGWLMRPEMVLFSAAFVLLVLGAQWTRDGWRSRVGFLAAAVALPLAYQLFRMGYYGSLVANTAIAKEGTDGNLDRGWAYLLDFVEPYWLWVPVLGLGAGYASVRARMGRSGTRRPGLVAATFVACAALSVVYVVFVGGDYHHSRMFLPALFALSAPVAALPAPRIRLAGAVVAAWAVLAVVSFRPDQLQGDNWLANGFLAPHAFGDVTRDEYGWGDTSSRLAWNTGPAYYYEAGITHYARSDMELRRDLDLPFGTFWGIGISAYSVGPDFHVLDQLGLADAFTAHLEGAPSMHPILPRFPGHEKPLPSPWLAARVTPPDTRPDPENFPPFGNPLLEPTTGDEFQEQVAWARAALQCDEISGLLESVNEPLTVQLFATNVLRSFENTFLRIPPDPEVAYRQFCGSGTPPEVAAVRRQS